MIRALRVARRSARQAGNQLLGLLTRAPEELRARLRKLQAATREAVRPFGVEVVPDDFAERFTR